MAQVFVIGLLIASIVFVVKAFKSVKKGFKDWRDVDDWRKYRKQQVLKGLKQFGIAVLCFVVMFVTIGILADNQDKQDKAKAEALAKYHASPEYKAKVAKEKADAEAKAKADAIKKQQEEANKKAQIKQEIEKSIVPDLKNYAHGYDDNWSQIWTPTMNYLSQGGTDFVQAYQNLQTLQSNYESFQTGVSIQSVDGMDDSDKKSIDDYNTNMSAAFYGRKDAVGKVMDMLNSGQFRPADITDAQNEIKTADGNMIQATADEITLLTKYGVDTKQFTK